MCCGADAFVDWNCGTGTMLSVRERMTVFDHRQGRLFCLLRMLHGDARDALRHQDGPVSDVRDEFPHEKQRGPVRGDVVAQRAELDKIGVLGEGISGRHVVLQCGQPRLQIL